jgi:hypothetical protein
MELPMVVGGRQLVALGELSMVVAARELVWGLPMVVGGHQLVALGALPILVAARELVALGEPARRSLMRQATKLLPMALPHLSFRWWTHASSVTSILFVDSSISCNQKAAPGSYQHITSTLLKDSSRQLQLAH